MSLEGFGACLIAPGHEKYDVTGRQNGIENIPGNKALRARLKAQPFGNLPWQRFFHPVGRPPGIDEGYRRGVTRFRYIQPLFMQGAANGRTGVPRQLADAQMVVLKDLEAAPLLHGMMPSMGAPADKRLLVAPVRQRENPSLTGKAAIADVVDKSVDLFQLWFEHLRKIKIGIPLIGLRMDFEEYGEHRSLPACYTAAMQSISTSKRPSQAGTQIKIRAG